MENYSKSLEDASQRGDVDGIRRIINEVKVGSLGVSFMC